MSIEKQILKDLHYNNISELTDYDWKEILLDYKLPCNFILKHKDSIDKNFLSEIVTNDNLDCLLPILNKQIIQDRYLSGDLKIDKKLAVLYGLV